MSTSSSDSDLSALLNPVVLPPADAVSSACCPACSGNNTTNFCMRVRSTPNTLSRDISVISEEIAIHQGHLNEAWTVALYEIMIAKRNNAITEDESNLLKSALLHGKILICEFNL